MQLGDGGHASRAPAARPSVKRSGSAAPSRAPRRSGGSREQLARARATRRARRSWRPWSWSTRRRSMCGPQLVGSVSAHRGHDLHRLLDARPAGSGRRAGSCPARRARGPLRVLGRDADRAGVGVALLGLDAADGHHHRPRGVGVVGALGQPLDDVDAGRDLAAGADLDPVAQARRRRARCARSSGPRSAACRRGPRTPAAPRRCRPRRRRR